MDSLQISASTLAVMVMLMTAACSTSRSPASPPPADAPIANVYILPGAVALGQNAFGDDPVVIYTGERMRWRNIDTETHDIVTDSIAFPEFTATGMMTAGSERSFVMNTTGMTRIHCTIHPQMVGTLIVQER